MPDFKSLLEPVLVRLANATSAVKGNRTNALRVASPPLTFDASTASTGDARALNAALARWENEGGASEPSREA